MGGLVLRERLATGHPGGDQAGIRGLELPDPTPITTTCPLGEGRSGEELNHWPIICPCNESLIKILGIEAQ